MSTTTSEPRTGVGPRPAVRRQLPVLALAVLAAALSVAVHELLFPRGSLDNDEVVYLQAARDLARGHLFLSVPSPPSAYQPWFYAPGPHGLVPKYLPLVSGLYALGLLLTGSVVPVLAVLAAATTVLAFWIGRAVGLGSRPALLAAAILSLSPLTLAQSGLVLSYLPFLVLLLAGWLLLLLVLAKRDLRPAALVALGLIGVAAACARPLDALVLLVPPLLLAARQARSRGTLLRSITLSGIGALPLTAAVLAYDALATGNALRLPFALLEPQDRLGFGVRRLFPEDAPHQFGPVQGLQGLVVHLVVAPLSWVTVGALVLPGALLSLRHWRRLDLGLRALLCSTGLLLVAYLGFWGPYNASVLWGGPHVVGPFYALPLALPLALAATPLLVTAARRRAALLVPVTIAALVVNGVASFSAVGRARDNARGTSTVLRAVAVARGQLLLDVDPPYLGHPVSELLNRPGRTGLALAARLPVPPAGAPVPDLLQLPEDPYRPGARLSYVLRRQHRLAATQVPLRVTLSGGRPGDLLVVDRAGRSRACPLAGAALVLTAVSVTGCGGTAVPAAWTREPYRHCSTDRCLSLGVYRPRPGHQPRQLGWRLLPVDVAHAAVALLSDGPVIRSSGGGWLTVTAAPS